jgi:hypothetical protein
MILICSVVGQCILHKSEQDTRLNRISALYSNLTSCTARTPLTVVNVVVV